MEKLQKQQLKKKEEKNILLRFTFFTRSYNSQKAKPDPKTDEAPRKGALTRWFLKNISLHKFKNSPWTVTFKHPPMRLMRFGDRENWQRKLGVIRKALFLLSIASNSNCPTDRPIASLKKKTISFGSPNNQQKQNNQSETYSTQKDIR